MKKNSARDLNFCMFFYSFCVYIYIYIYLVHMFQISQDPFQAMKYVVEFYRNIINFFPE